MVDPWHLAEGERLDLTEDDAARGFRMHKLRRLAATAHLWTLDGFATKRGTLSQSARCEALPHQRHQERHQAPHERCTCGYRIVRDPAALGPFLDLMDRARIVQRIDVAPRILMRFMPRGHVTGREGDDPARTLRCSRLVVVPGVAVVPQRWADLHIVLPRGVTVRVVESLSDVGEHHFDAGHF